jgi:RHS repeat-associated protein
MPTIMFPPTICSVSPSFLLEVGSAGQPDKLSLTSMAITDYYVTTDAMGSVTAILDEDGNVLERRSYDAFGGMTCMTPDGTPVAESPTGLDVGFQGQIRDEGTGLYQMGYRWYNPVLGRWLSRDPIGLRGGLNLLRALDNRGQQAADPFGEMFFVEHVDPTTGRTVTDEGATAMELRDVILRCEDGSIARVRFTGHGEAGAQGIDDTKGMQEHLYVNAQGVVVLAGKSFARGDGGARQAFMELLKRKLQRNARIDLEGCCTARRELIIYPKGRSRCTCIAEVLSESLPGVTVSGFVDLAYDKGNFFRSADLPELPSRGNFSFGRQVSYNTDTAPASSDFTGNPFAPFSEKINKSSGYILNLPLGF